MQPFNPVFLTRVPIQKPADKQGFHWRETAYIVMHRFCGSRQCHFPCLLAEKKKKFSCSKVENQCTGYVNYFFSVVSIPNYLNNHYLVFISFWYLFLFWFFILAHLLYHNHVLDFMSTPGLKVDTSRSKIKLSFLFSWLDMLSGRLSHVSHLTVVVKCVYCLLCQRSKF